MLPAYFILVHLIHGIARRLLIVLSLSQERENLHLSFGATILPLPITDRLVMEGIAGPMANGQCPIALILTPRLALTCRKSAASSHVPKAASCGRQQASVARKMAGGHCGENGGKVWREEKSPKDKD